MGRVFHGARRRAKIGFRADRRSPDAARQVRTLRSAGSQTVSSSATATIGVDDSGGLSRKATPDDESTMVFGPIFSIRVTVAEAEGSNFKSAQQRAFEIQRHPLEIAGSVVQKLE